ncbi:SusC/RagA family TonB-linked outer membrane protein [Sphingobacterium sp. LRF_L2]|uniref:SusC/RagA family TonB-linked outer membrane protein n=1 Tax=Sphingobacterium sp. LRF_L2 TaxID=3369421 RepID=UPI003F648948
MKYSLTFFFGFLLCLSSKAQPFVTQLKVSDGNKPISEVTVWIDGHAKGTTDANGLFLLQRLDNSPFSLRLLHAQWQQLDTVLQPTVAEIILWMKPKAIEIEQVEVSTGYQHVARYQTTGAFESIERDLLDRQIGTTILPMLDGLAAGLTFDRRKGAMNNLQIRGLSTLSSDLTKPLIVLDNFPYEGDLESINPLDVANVTLLKDASASAIWGAKAGNGVLVITTKKGNRNRPSKIDFSSNLTWIERPDVFYVPRISSADYIENEKFLFEKGAYNTNLNNTTTRPMISPVVELLDAVRKGKMDETDALAQIEDLKQYDIRDDYKKYLYRTGFNQQYFLSLNAGNDRFGYLFSTGLDRNLSTSRGNAFDRVNLRSMNTFQATDKLSLQFDVNFVHSKTTTNNPGELTNIYPYARLADDDGNALAVDRSYRYNYIDTAGGGLLMDWRYYPLKEIEQRDNWSGNSNLRMNLGMRYAISSVVNLDLRYQFEREFGKSFNYQSEDLFFTRDLINRFSTITNGAVTYRIPKGGILDLGNSTMGAHNVRAQLNIDRSWGMGHTLTAMAGAEVRKIDTDDSYYRTYGYNDKLKTNSSVDYVTRYQIYDKLAGTLAIPYVDNFASSDNRTLSFFSNAAYSYLQRYTLSLSARRDASNLFGVQTNDKWKPLWSAGLKWTVHQEPFFRSEYVNQLIVRSSFGHSGNVNNAVPAVATISYNSSLSTLARLPYAYLQNAPNPDLRWEDVAQWNIGMDAAFLKNKLTLSFDYYRKNATDLITAEDADPTLGMSSFTRNSGNLRTEGIDLSLGANLIDRAWKWNVNLLASWNEDKLKKINRETLSLTAGEYYIPPAVEYPMNALFSYRFMGLNPETGAPLGLVDGELSEDYASLTNSSKITLDDLVYHGTVVPRFFGNLRNTVAYRGFSLSVNISGKFAYFYRRGTVLYTQLMSTSFVQTHGDYEKRWQNPGDEAHTTVPSVVYPASTSRDNFYRLSDATVEDASHIRLQDLSFSYSPRWIGYGVKGATFRFYCNNLNVILWKKSKVDLDPQYGANIPIARSYALGLNVQF